MVNTLNDALMSEVLERNSRLQGDSDQSEGATSEEQQQALVRCLVESAKNIFSTMCDIPLTADESTSGEDASKRYHVSGIIGLSGALKATIVVSVHKDLVFHAAEGFLGMRPTEIDADVTDLVGELANMIGGNAKERMKMEGLSIGLPTVVAGDNHKVSYNSGMALTVLPFESDHGPLSIELGVA